MNLILALLLVFSQDYINLIMEGKYDEAINYCDEMINKTRGGKSFKWKLEKGDIYFNKINDSDKALEIYQELIDNYPPEGGFWIFSKRYGYPDLGWIYLRLAQSFEMNEDYLNSAKSYEIVATKFRKFPLDSFALSGVERCFKKNYQEYVATVDGYNITRLELDERIANTSRFGRSDEKSILDQIIVDRLIYANAVINNIEETDFFQENIKDKKKTLLLEEVHSANVIEKAELTENEMKRYYYKNKENYKVPEEIRGKEIVVESDSIARFLHDSLTKNIESFDTLAKLYSTATSRDAGGNMKAVQRGSKPKPIEDIIFSAELNKLTEIIPFDDKFGIYLITEHKPKRYHDFEDVKSTIEKSLRPEKIKATEEKFLKKLRTGAKIKIYHFPDTISLDSISELQDKIVAMINGRKILWVDLEKKNASQPRFAQSNLTKSSEREKLLNTVIDEELKLELGEKNKSFLHDGYFTRLMNEIIRLMGQGLYMKIVIEGVKVDSQLVEDYYKKHKNEFKVPEAVRCREIVVNSRTFAEELRNIVLKNPEKFDSLAREHSTAGTKTRGGDTGLIRRGFRSNKFEEVAFKLKAGSISKVFSLDGSSYTFLEVVEHNPESYQEFETVRPHIERKLLDEKRRHVADDFLTKIKEDAEIEIFLGETEKEEEAK